MTKNQIVTRFAPSPTGLLHLGAYRTAIFSYLFARKNEGKFIVRIEDTDKARSTKEFEDNILESLKWLNMNYDEFYRQSDNAPRHKFYLEKMIAEGNAYVSKEEAKDGSGIIKEIVRFKNPNTDVTFNDEIKGSVTMNTTDLGDFVIAKNLNEPLFHLAVVVDDFEEGVTHIIRGEDHVSNTPRQILIQRAIGAPTPTYAHLPLVLGYDKQKLSKRKGALSVTAYRDKGYLPEAILNSVAFIGWNPGTEQELFSPQELIHSFELNQVQKSPAVLSEVKLKWFNKEHIKKLNVETQKKLVSQFITNELKSDKSIFEKVFPIIIERIDTFEDVTTMMDLGEFDFIIKSPSFDRNLLICDERMRKGVEVTNETISNHLKNVVSKLHEIPESTFDSETVKASIWDYATENGRGIVLWAMRVALSGREKSPDPFQISGIIGKTETIKRLTDASNL